MPFKGSVDITVTNSGTEAWGDFPFFIFQVGRKQSKMFISM